MEWFQKVFVPGTSHLDGPKLLIFDGHNSHISPQVVEAAIQNNTELLCLPAHTSSILQPLDVGVFKAVKGAWRKCLKAYYDETRYCNVDKRAFPKLLKRLVDSNAFSLGNAVSAFESCGICPLNRGKISADKLAASIPLTHESTNPTVTGNPREYPVCPIPNTSASTLGPSPSHMVEVPQGPVSSVPENTPKATLTPRKALETAILTHLRQITPTDKTEKRARVRRTLAECLTSEEALARLHEDELRKRKPLKRCRAIAGNSRNQGTVNKPVKKCRTNVTGGMEDAIVHDDVSGQTTSTPKNQQIQKRGRCRELRGLKKDVSKCPNIVIRKPNWLKNKESSQQAISLPINTANDRIDDHLDDSVEPSSESQSMNYDNHENELMSEKPAAPDARTTAAKTVQVSKTCSAPQDATSKITAAQSTFQDNISSEQPQFHLATVTFYKSRSIRKPSRYAN